MRNLVTYVLIGGLARVLEGSDELTRGVDLTPSMRPENLRRLELTLERLDARPVGGGVLSFGALDQTPVLELESNHGEIKLVREPEGTRGYDDLRRAARREAIGEGLRIPVASPATSFACSPHSGASPTSSRSRRCDALSSSTADSSSSVDSDLTTAVRVGSPRRSGG